MKKIAFYDMDRTITRRPTYIPFLSRFAAHENMLRLLAVALVPVLVVGYALRFYGRTRLKELCQRVMMGRAAHPEAVSRVAEAFARDMTDRGSFADARTQIAADRAAGYTLVLATASYRFYTAAIAHHLGFDDVVATLSDVDREGRILPRVRGVNCYGPGKLEMVRAWLDEQKCDRAACTIRFYSDHISDQPVFEWSDEAFAINANAPLYALAQEKGWTNLTWR